MYVFNGCDYEKNELHVCSVCTDGQDVVDSNPRSSTGSSGISYPPNMPSRAPSNVDSSFSGSLGIYSGESMSTSYPSRLAAVVDKYRQEYVTKSLDIGVLQISEHDALVERAIADLPVMVTRTARYARLLKNVHTNVADYYARASLAFHCLELYGLSLLRYPWKSELQKISVRMCCWLRLNVLVACCSYICFYLNCISYSL